MYVYETIWPFHEPDFIFYLFLKVISVAIGTDADHNELEKATTNRKNLIKSSKSEEAKALGKKIVKIIVKGNEELVSTSNYPTQTV